MVVYEYYLTAIFASKFFYFEVSCKLYVSICVHDIAFNHFRQVVFIDDHLYTILDILRHKLGKPVIITSGYRTPEWNAKCGGAKYSYHMRGMAADIRVNGMSAKEIANKLNEIVPDECGIIVYNTWVHFDVRPGKKYRKGV